MKRYKKNWTYFNKNVEKETRSKGQMPFLDPSPFLLPSYSEAVNTKETIYTVLFFIKPRRQPIIAH